jgi:DNA-binding transcriptional LysR family regulator
MMDRLAAMEAFVRVVDARSFSGTAKQLRVGQPAVSKTIAQLEERLGVRLLLRSTHGLTPTEGGRNFYERAKRSIEEAEEAELTARDAAAALTGRLRISAPLTFAQLQIVPRLPEFFGENPALEIDLVLEDRDVDSIAEGVDVALWIGPVAASSLIARKIAVCRRVVVGASHISMLWGSPEPKRSSRASGRHL